MRKSKRALRKPLHYRRHEKSVNFLVSVVWMEGKWGSRLRSLWEVGILLIWILDGGIIDKAFGFGTNGTSFLFFFFFFFFRIGSQVIH